VINLKNLSAKGKGKKGGTGNWEEMDDSGRTLGRKRKDELTLPIIKTSKEREE